MNINETEIRKAIALLKPNNALFEIRFIGSGKLNFSGYFTNADDLVRKLRTLNPSEEGNVYITLNEINSACYSRQQKDCFVRNCKNTTSDNDITAYKWLMLDFDPERPSGTSSSCEELKTAYEKAKTVYKYLSGRGFHDPVKAMSGNGYHLLYKLDLEKNSENTELIKNVLKTLNILFGDHKLKVDTSVFNPSRICKLYGTMAVKGASTEERPHRMAKILSSSEETEKIGVNPKELLTELIKELPKAPEKPKRYSSSGVKEFNLDEWIIKNNVNITEKIPFEGSGTKYILEQCPFDENHKGKDACLLKLPNGALAFKCFHNSCSGKGWREFRVFYEPEAYSSKAEPKEPTTRIRPVPGIEAKETAEHGAEIMPDNIEEEFKKKSEEIKELAKTEPLNGEIYKFCENYFFDPSDAEEFLESFVRSAAKEQKRLSDFKDKKKKLLKKISDNRKKAEEAERINQINSQRKKIQASLPKWVWLDEKGRRRLDEIRFIEEFSTENQLKYFSGSFYGIEGRMTNLSISQQVQRILGDYFTEKIAQMTKRVIEGMQNKCYCEDVEPGTNKIHIKNGYLTTDDKGLFTVFVPAKNFCLNRLNVEYSEQEQKFPKFLKYLSEVYKPEDIKTIQQFLGYCLLPTNRLQLCLLLNGEGGEGKSQLGQIFSDIIGEGNIIQSKLQKVQERFGLANCANKLVFLDDDLDGKALVETGNFKTLVTSKGKLEAEMKNVQQNSGQFYIRFVCFSNKVLQSLYDQTEGFYRRLLVLQTKPKDENRKVIQDLGGTILKEEKAGVFRWLVDGLNELISNDWNLYVSESSQSLSETLKRESDTIDLFFTENPNIVLGQGGEIHTADLYTQYAYYCGDNALKPVNEYVFPKVISERQKRYHIEKANQLIINGKRARGYKGIKLLQKHTTSSFSSDHENFTVIRGIS